MSRMIAMAALICVTTAFPGRAADKRIKPLPADECRAIARSLGQAAGIPLSARIGRPAYPGGLSGDACLLSGNASGLTTDFLAAQQKLDQSLAGWTPVLDYDADGPYGTTKGFTKGAQTVLYSLETRPPVGTCENIVIADCKVPRRQWGWTLEVVGFVE